MEKSYVSIEQKICPICLKKFESNAILIDRRMRNSMERNTITGYEICPECKKKLDNGYMALIVSDPSKSKVTNGKSKIEDAYRTGEILWIKRDVFNKIFNTDEKRPFVFCDEELPKKLKGMMKQNKKDKFKLRFQDPVMQKHYESLIKSGNHWKTAERKTIQRFKEYDGGY